MFSHVGHVATEVSLDHAGLVRGMNTILESVMASLQGNTFTFMTVLELVSVLG